MFEAEQELIEAQIINYFSRNEIPWTEAISWAPIPFSGEWGISTSFFKVAAQLFIVVLETLASEKYPCILVLSPIIQLNPLDATLFAMLFHPFNECFANPLALVFSLN